MIRSYRIDRSVAVETALHSKEVGTSRFGCREKGIPIRVGVNSGSLEKHILAKFGGPTPDALAESAMENVRLLNSLDFDDICISAKASDVITTVKTYRLLSQMTEYPLHIGVTEAGTEYRGVIKSAVGIGALLDNA